jgi:hypothetical protein
LVAGKEVGTPKRSDLMKRRTKTWLLSLGSALVTTAVVGVAFAAMRPEVPEGPSIDFCPTTEQIEAHLEKYGFDYKPTVACGESGEEVASGVEEDTESDEVVFAREKERLLRATRGEDVDGDPTTIEIVYADGTESVIFVQAENPTFWKDLTLDEVAELLYP